MDNLSRLQQAYRDWNDCKAQCFDMWTELFADRCDLRSAAAGRSGVEWTESRMSKDGVVDYLKGLTAQFDMIHYTMDQYTCRGDTIVAMGTMGWRNKATDKVVDTWKIDVWQFADEKAVAFHEYYDTRALLDSTTH